MGDSNRVQSKCYILTATSEIMKIKNIWKICLAGVGIFAFSCTSDLIEMNQNPNGSDPDKTNPNLILSTVLTESAKSFVALGYQDIAGVMQHTQKDGWATGHNAYDWGGSNNWAGYYSILRNNQFVYEKAVEADWGLHQGITLVMKSLMFGLITDLWGDAPYSQSLQGHLGGNEYTFPVYDSQEKIYEGILADLEKANNILRTGNVSATVGASDVYFNGDVTKWRRFANSLALRYYMRLAEKAPSVAKAGIEKIAGDPDMYPIITQVDEDVTMSYPGNNNGDSWPSNATYDTDSTNYRRIKMADTFVRALKNMNDPRLGVWAEKVQVFLLVNDKLPSGTDIIKDTVVNGENRKVRYLSPDKLLPAGTTIENINQSVDYVGLPTNISTPYQYNQNQSGTQSARNPHVSWVNKRFADAKSGIKARVLSAAEVHFILAEASAVYGWNAGDAETHYNQGILASFAAWGLASQAAAYIQQPKVAFDGSQEQILTQKWIASWSVATEAWFDWRRTGYPVLKGAGVAGVLPVRFYYMLEERNLNTSHVNAANDRLEVTPFSANGDDGVKNSIWSKPWIIQGTGKPW